MQYRIGEFARLSGVSIKTLRFYDQIGLLRPTAVDVRTRYRHYLPQQLRDLAAIRALKDLGASLEDIRRVIGHTASAAERRKLLQKLRTNAEHSLETARRSLVWIDAALGESVEGERDIPVVLKERSEVRVASIRASVNDYIQINQLERDLQRAIGPTLAGTLHGVLWHRCAESGRIEGEPFVEVSQRVARSGAYDVKVLPASTVASAYCESEDRAAERTYEAIDRWMRLHDYRVDGPRREIYVGQILEIQFPVKLK